MRTRSWAVSMAVLLAMLALTAACGSDGGGGGSTAAAPPSGPPLSGLVVSAGTLNPAFASNTINYTLRSLGTAVSVTVTPTATSPAATITVNGTTVVSGATSTPIPFALGANTITTVVTDTTGTRTYTISTNLSGGTSTTFVSAPTMTARMTRNGTVSECTGTAKVYPGPFTETVAYKTYTFHHSGPSACVSVVLIPDAACRLNVFASAYSSSFNPTSLGTNYLGDAGSSSVIEAFSFMAPANSDYVVVVNTIGGVTGCPFEFTVRE